MLDAMIFAVPVAMAFHLAIGFVLKFRTWKANGRTFHATPAPAAPASTRLAELAQIADDVASLTDRVAEVAEVVRSMPAPAPRVAIATSKASPVAVAVVEVEANWGTVVPFTRPTERQPDYAAMTSEQLRRLCQERGIKWRNARGQGKHLSKGAMVAALSA